MTRLSRRDVDRLTDVFLGALQESGMTVPREAAAETITGLARQGRSMTDEFVTELALQLLAERVAEKPGSNIHADPDSVTVSLHDVGQLIQALGVAGSVVLVEGDPVVESLRRHALGHLAVYGLGLQHPDSVGRIAVQRSLLHRTSRTVRTIANQVEEGAKLEAHDEPIRDGLVEQIRRDANLAEALAGPTS